MHHEAVGGQRLALDGVFVGEQPQLRRPLALPAKPVRRARQHRARQPGLAAGVPDDLGHRVALGHGVHQVRDELAHRQRGQRLAHQLGGLVRAVAVVGGLDLQRERGHRHAPGAEHGAVVQVFLGDLVGGDQVVARIALRRAAQDARHPRRRQAGQRAPVREAARAAARGGGDLLAQVGSGHGWASSVCAQRRRASGW